MKNTLALLFLFSHLAFYCQAQDPRDAVVGSYLTQYQADGGPGPIFWDTLVVTKNMNDPDQIRIWYTTDGGGYFYDFEQSDSSFTGSIFPDLMYGKFYANDSIWVYRHLFNSSHPWYEEYWGFKILGEPTGIIEVASTENELTAYYEAFSSLLNIKCAALNGNTTLRLFDVSGKEVFATTLEINNEWQTVDTPSLRSGIYLLVVNHNNKQFTKKILIP